MPGRLSPNEGDMAWGDAAGGRKKGRDGRTVLKEEGAPGDSLSARI